MRVATFSGLSLHAGQGFFVEYVQVAQGSLNQVYLVLGVDKGAQAKKEKRDPVAHTEMHPNSFSTDFELQTAY